MSEALFLMRITGDGCQKYTRLTVYSYNDCSIMKTSALKYTILSWVSGPVMLILLFVPFHALLTVWGASLFGHYTALRLWKEVLLAVSALGAFYLVIFDHKIRSHTLPRRLVQLILAY